MTLTSDCMTHGLGNTAPPTNSAPRGGLYPQPDALHPSSPPPYMNPVDHSSGSMLTSPGIIQGSNYFTPSLQPATPVNAEQTRLLHKLAEDNAALQASQAQLMTLVSTLAAAFVPKAAQPNTLLPSSMNAWGGPATHTAYPHTNTHTLPQVLPETPPPPTAWQVAGRGADGNALLRTPPPPTAAASGYSPLVGGGGAEYASLPASHAKDLEQLQYRQYPGPAVQVHPHPPPTKDAFPLPAGRDLSVGKSAAEAPLYRYQVPMPPHSSPTADYTNLTRNTALQNNYVDETMVGYDCRRLPQYPSTSHVSNNNNTVLNKDTSSLPACQQGKYADARDEHEPHAADISGFTDISTVYDSTASEATRSAGPLHSTWLPQDVAESSPRSPSQMASGKDGNDDDDAAARPPGAAGAATDGPMPEEFTLASVQQSFDAMVGLDVSEDAFHKVTAVDPTVVGVIQHLDGAVLSEAALAIVLSHCGVFHRVRLIKQPSDAISTQQPDTDTETAEPPRDEAPTTPIWAVILFNDREAVQRLIAIFNNSMLNCNSPLVRCTDLMASELLTYNLQFLRLLTAPCRARSLDYDGEESPPKECRFGADEGADTRILADSHALVHNWTSLAFHYQTVVRERQKAFEKSKREAGEDVQLTTDIPKPLLAGTTTKAGHGCTVTELIQRGTTNKLGSTIAVKPATVSTSAGKAVLLTPLQLPDDYPEYRTVRINYVPLDIKPKQLRALLDVYGTPLRVRHPVAASHYTYTMVFVEFYREKDAERMLNQPPILHRAVPTMLTAGDDKYVPDFLDLTVIDEQDAEAVKESVNAFKRLTAAPRAPTATQYSPLHFLLGNNPAWSPDKLSVTLSKNTILSDHCTDARFHSCKSSNGDDAYIAMQCTYGWPQLVTRGTFSVHAPGHDAKGPTTNKKLRDEEHEAVETNGNSFTNDDDVYDTNSTVFPGGESVNDGPGTVSPASIHEQPSLQPNVLRTVHLRNVPNGATVAELMAFLTRYGGTIIRIRMCNTAVFDTHHFGFAEFSSEEEARTFIESVKAVACRRAAEEQEAGYTDEATKGTDGKMIGVAAGLAKRSIHSFSIRHDSYYRVLNGDGERVLLPAASRRTADKKKKDKESKKIEGSRVDPLMQQKSDRLYLHQDVEAYIHSQPYSSQNPKEKPKDANSSTGLEFVSCCGHRRDAATGELVLADPMIGALLAADVFGGDIKEHTTTLRYGMNLQYIEESLSSLTSSSSTTTTETSTLPAPLQTPAEMMTAFTAMCAADVQHMMEVISGSEKAAANISALTALQVAMLDRCAEACTLLLEKDLLFQVAVFSNAEPPKGAKRRSTTFKEAAALTSSAFFLPRYTLVCSAIAADIVGLELLVKTTTSVQEDPTLSSNSVRGAQQWFATITERLIRLLGSALLLLGQTDNERLSFLWPDRSSLRTPNAPVVLQVSTPVLWSGPVAPAWPVTTHAVAVASPLSAQPACAVALVALMEQLRKQLNIMTTIVFAGQAAGDASPLSTAIRALKIASRSTYRSMITPLLSKIQATAENDTADKSGKRRVVSKRNNATSNGVILLDNEQHKKLSKGMRALHATWSTDGNAIMLSPMTDALLGGPIVDRFTEPGFARLVAECCGFGGLFLIGAGHCAARRLPNGHGSPFELLTVHEQGGKNNNNQKEEATPDEVLATTGAAPLMWITSSESAVKAK